MYPTIILCTPNLIQNIFSIFVTIVQKLVKLRSSSYIPCIRLIFENFYQDYPVVQKDEGIREQLRIG